MKNKDNLEKIEGFYKTITNLPVECPGEFSLFNSGFRETPKEDYNSLSYASFFATRKSKYFSSVRGRTDLWKKYIVPEWVKLSLEEMAEKEGLKVKISNHIFRSRLSINGSNEIKLDIWAPKNSTLCSYLWGNEVKARLRKN